ncbi:MAG: DUF2922 domain-containing protein [Defluviitaleaceae bacterium]|nr:DUF2922 domain-containing protein [Defluviitaleaceae bacterium]
MVTKNSEVVELMFLTESGGRRAIRVPNPPPTLTVQAVNTAASSFIEANPFEEEIGPLVSLHRADRVQVTRIILLPEPAVA